MSRTRTLGQNSHGFCSEMDPTQALVSVKDGKSGIDEGYICWKTKLRKLYPSFLARRRVTVIPANEVHLLVAKRMDTILLKDPLILTKSISVTRFRRCLQTTIGSSNHLCLVAQQTSLDQRKCRVCSVDSLVMRWHVTAHSRLRIIHTGYIKTRGDHQDRPRTLSTIFRRIFPDELLSIKMALSRNEGSQRMPSRNTQCDGL